MDDQQQYRIGIIGAAGTGKSTLGLELARELELPFLASKDITVDILKKDGYDYAYGMQIERFLAQGTRQDQILRRTVKQLKDHEQFVADRTVVDLAAYAVCELADADVAHVKKLYDRCHRHIGLYTHLFVCPWNGDIPADNRKRTLNPWYQFKIHSLALGILDQWKVEFHVFSDGDTDARLREVLKILGKRKRPVRKSD